ncbi:hypothetical protein [Lewinella sp. 4G2]|uniref:hypothetical protein n=1 Tax=Lewinella sp. 4G2 TaxID=1803372 RepID=UPI0007B4A6E6|nr:hypothetical protein [Lewinella sp. 4G2]OAV44872.1 hypothetical protein A3850_010380 [Lewinella sp. 4G2]
MSRFRNPLERSPLGTVGSILVALLFFYLLFKLLGFVFSLIWYVAPLIFIASLVIDYKVFVGFLTMLGNLFKKNWIWGLAAGIASVVLFPLVSLYLLGMAMFKKKMKTRAEEMDERVNGRWAEYEDVTPEPMDIDIPYEELPPAPEPQTRGRNKGTDYDQLFE